MPKSTGPNARKRARLILVAVAIGLAMLAAPVVTTRLPYWLEREALIAFLWAVLLAQIAGLVVLPIATVALGLILVRTRRRGVSKPWASRLLLLAVSTLIALVCAEAACAWVVSIRGMPTLPTTFPADRDRNPAMELRIATIGESSALGVPYKDWLSVPAIVAWQLERVFPGRKVTVEMLAMGGANLARCTATWRD